MELLNVEKDPQNKTRKSIQMLAFFVDITVMP